MYLIAGNCSDLYNILHWLGRCLQTDGEHMHDDRVTSVGFEIEGECDGRRLNAWLSTLMMKQGVDLFRSKGILAIHRSPERCDCSVARNPGGHCQISFSLGMIDAC